ncbi:hypothetical protein QBC32DRAFT_356237 [Pseudoneurospora amorphoporcata]|uniref:Uncharacterized protein n=1 Tax=Pseudoneurospora amorphoporcata TaxID=241081 RepID=A0AAN6NJB9_9PEZI|nr:hypothetical protein QBC32DRAFT_356237 [Pseudoneurospora amorphoporcata]
MPKRQPEGSVRVAFVLISRLPASLRAKPHTSMPGGGELNVRTVNFSRNPPNYIHPFSAASPLTVMPPSERYGYGSWWFSFLTLPRD